MKSKIIFLIYSILLIFSCQKEKEVTKLIEAPKTIQKEENIEAPLFLVTKGNYNPEMVIVEGSEFIMGDNSLKSNQLHKVTLSSFYMAKYLITIKEWKSFLDDVDLEYTWDWETQYYGLFHETVPTDDCPAQGLNWYYALVFCNWASLKDGLNPAYLITELPDKEFTEISVEWDKTANGYRLPTDAEWEYAARGGMKSKGFKYPGSNDSNDIGRFGKEYKTSYPVGEYLPNELGIFDMGGNASEWCWDWYDEIMFDWLPVENPSVDLKTQVQKKAELGYDLKVMRGASWTTGPREIARRGAYRPINIFSTGIRLVRNAE